MSQPATPEPTGSCLIVDTAVYQEAVCIRPIDAQPGNHEFVIRSRLDTARNPNALHTRYQVTLSTQELSRLHAHLGAYLEQRPPA